MAAATKNRFGERQPGDLVSYNGASGYRYYKDTLIITGGSGAVIRPLSAGVSSANFLGVASNNVDLTAGLGSSQAILDIWKTGVFTFEANGTGISSNIGKYAFGLDDQTVGLSVATPCIRVGEIVGIPTSTTYRVRIMPMMWDPLGLGVSFNAPVNQII